MKRFFLNFFLMLLVCLIFNDICSAQGQWQQIGENGLAASNAIDQSLTFDSEGTPYIAYQDKAKNFKATVKKFDGSNWVTVGEAGFSTGYVKSVSLVMDGNDTPYVAYIDNGNDAEAIVKKFNGKSWVNAGSTNFSVDYAAGISLVTNSKGIVYAAFQSKGNEGRATVKKFNGNSWINVGGNGFSKSYANNISLAFDSNDVPYISFVDEETGGIALVKKFNGKRWENLNTTGLDDKYVTGLSLAIDGKNNPYILYRDETADYKATVKKYNGKSWEVVGAAGFSDGKVQHTKLVATNKGTLYVTYVDFGNGAIGKVGTTNVRKFNGESWEDISYPNVRTINNLDNKFSLSLLLNKNDIPYLAYSNKANGAKATVLKLSTTVEPNKRPVANAGDDITITLPTKKVQLQGSGSDEDGTISSYLWRQVSGPNKAKFDIEIESPTVTNLVVGVYVFSLTTKDNKNTSSSADKITITVLESEAPLQKVVSFTLIDADTKKELKKLTDGATINLASFSAKKLSIRANTNSEVGSVVFELTGEQNKNNTENIAPFDLDGDDNAWLPVIGDYSIKATPFTNAGGNGTEGSGLEVSFSVINDNSDNDNGNQDANEVTFILINADNSKEIQTIKNGATINLAKLPTKNISIRVDTEAKVGSVKMKLSGKLNRKQVENIAPYSLFGGNNGNYNPWKPLEGSYTLEITPYSARAGKGKAGAISSINFDIIDQSVTPTSSQMTTAARKKQEIKESVASNPVVVYPNPTDSDLHIEVSEAGEGEATINLLDTSGRKVLSRHLYTTSNLTTVLIVNQLHPGVYILVVNTAKGSITKRVVIK